jgi:hypothetical protein
LRSCTETYRTDVIVDRRHHRTTVSMFSQGKKAAFALYRNGPPPSVTPLWSTRRATFRLVL